MLFPFFCCLVCNSPYDVFRADFILFAGVQEQADHFFAAAAIGFRAVKIDIIDGVNILRSLSQQTLRHAVLT